MVTDMRILQVVHLYFAVLTIPGDACNASTCLLKMGSWCSDRNRLFVLANTKFFLSMIVANRKMLSTNALIVAYLSFDFFIIFSFDKCMFHNYGAVVWIVVERTLLVAVLIVYSYPRICQLMTSISNIS